MEHFSPPQLREMVFNTYDFYCFYSYTPTATHSPIHKVVRAFLIGVNTVVSSCHFVDFYGHALHLTKELKEVISSQ